MRRGSIIQLAAIGIVVAVICSLVALLIPWLPVAAGEEATRIHFVFWFATAIAIGVFAVVAAVLIYCIWKFRVAEDDLSDGPPTHGHTQLEIVWTVIPAVLVTAISIVSAIVLAQNAHAGKSPLVVQVVGRQFEWSFTYPNGKTYPMLRVPEGRHTKLEITATDVIHGFWVPELSQKQDAVPGQKNPIVITPTRTGTFPVVCTELCGVGHALMRSEIQIMPAGQFDAWLKSGGSAAAASPGLASFQTYGCGGCHQFTPAASNGKVGPSLDNLKTEAAQAHRGALVSFIHESIVSPNAYVQPGYPANVMPQNFGQTIPADKLTQLVQYLAQGAK